MTLVLIFLCLFYFWCVFGDILLSNKDRQFNKKLAWRRNHNKQRVRLYIENSIGGVFWLSSFSLSFALGHPWLTISILILITIQIVMTFRFSKWAADQSLAWNNYLAKTQRLIKVKQAVALVLLLLIIPVFYWSFMETTMIDQLLAERDQLGDFPIPGYIIMWLLSCACFLSLLVLLSMKATRALGNKEEVHALIQWSAHTGTEMRVNESSKHKLLLMIKEAEKLLHVPEKESILKKGKKILITKLLIGGSMLLLGVVGIAAIPDALGMSVTFFDLALLFLPIICIVQKWEYRFADQTRQELWLHLVKQQGPAYGDRPSLDGPHWQYEFADWVRKQVETG
ncbi:hypothetical protein M3N64_07100 [Sporolactobacillus sp. CPB3-1]|uniref:Uncharacterized protein n=1 Tax=Sporolactobacillus mangiferae TaxID=2940498 RepID=A0ABT0MA25_9BACL|nr:hypothetical protein [Sporolactobacillus mangiferae]MCL1631715.1 hypothetical protein [Sporolactobacillus mangiferae]